MIHFNVNVQPIKLEFSDRTDLKITLSATNTDNHPVNPRLEEVTLLVNKKQSKVWDLAVRNGRRDKSWHLLPPGESVIKTWSALGASLFPIAGIYNLEFWYKDTPLLFTIEVE